MSTDAVQGFVQVIAQYRLLDPGQQDELARTLQFQFTEPRDLFRDLVQRGWLTPFQANQLLMGRGETLVLGSYVLLERLTETLMGEMYRARHQAMRRMVALQVIRADLLQKPEAVQRFYHEVQAAGVLCSPHVVAAYDAGPMGATHFFALEYVEGVDLGRLVQESGPLPIDQACDFTHQAALGLQHAYERGLLHHDLTPANLLVVARHLGPRRSEVSATARRKTALGVGALLKVQNLGLTFVGQQKSRIDVPQAPTFTATDFQAPELAQEGRVPDVRSEIYSLGCCLYYQLAGGVPFPGGTDAEKAYRHQTKDPPPLESLRPGVPEEVHAVLRSMMARRPEDRLASPGEVATALAPLVQAASVSFTPQPVSAEEQGTFVDRLRAPTLPDIQAEAPAEEVTAEPAAEPTPPVPGSSPERTWQLAIVTGLLLSIAAVGLFLRLLLAPGSPGPEVVPHVEPQRQRLGKAFNGVTDYFDVPHAAALEPAHLTVETWVQISEIPSGPDARRWLINKNIHENAEGHYGLVISGLKAGAYLNIGGGEGNAFPLWTPQDLQLDRWHHLAMTYDGATLRLYLDGVEAAQRAVNRPRVEGKTPLTIGRRQDGWPVFFFKGRLDDIRLYDRALNAEEVKAHFENPAASVAKPEKGLIRYWRY